MIDHQRYVHTCTYELTGLLRLMDTSARVGAYCSDPLQSETILAVKDSCESKEPGRTPVNTIKIIQPADKMAT